MRYDRTTLIEELQALCRRLGRSPLTADVVGDAETASAPTYLRHFGSMAAARAAAGLPEPTRKTKWTRESIKDALMRATGEAGRAPSRSELARYEYLPHVSTIQENFGSLQEALHQCGLRARRRSPNDDITDAMLLEELRRVAVQLGRAPKAKSLSDSGCRYAVGLYRSRFGSYLDALRKAGISARKWSRKPSRAALVGQLARLGSKLGRPPQVTDLTRAGVASYGVFVDVFGSFPNALLAAGIGTEHLPDKYDGVTNDALIRALARLADLIQRTPDRRLVDYLPGFPGSTVFVRRFGSWNLAIEEAGLPVLRRKYKAADGHQCDSYDERMIDDFLDTEEIAHELHPLYPRHASLNPNRSLVADWALEGGVLVEYWGVVGREKYDERRRLKIRVAEATGTTLLQIFPTDLGVDLSRLRQLFAPYRQLGGAQLALL